MREISQSTIHNVMVFMTDSSDHIAGKTSLTLTVTASKDGAAFASISPTVTERGNGWYNLALTTSHTDTLGDLAIHITATGADPTDLVMRVVAVNKADSVRMGLTALPNAAADAAGGLPISDAGGLDLDGVLSGNTPQTGDAYARLGAPVGASISADVAASLTAIGNLNDFDPATDTVILDATQANYAPAKAGDEMDLVNAPNATAVSAIQSGLATSANVTTIVGHLTDIKGAGWTTTDTLEAIRDRGDAAWITATGFSTHSAADVRSEMDSNSTQLSAIVADTNELQTNQGNWLTATGFSTFDPTTDTIETGITYEEAAQYVSAIVCGIIADAGTGTETFKAIGNSGTTRVTVTVDGSGNRSGVAFS